MIRAFFHLASTPVIYMMKPLKSWAYRTRFALIRRLILEFTEFVDWASIILNVQNQAMLLNWRANKRGNFIFGAGVMITDYDAAATALAKPLFKNNNFMGVRIVAGDNDVFATNSPMLQQGPPLRKQSRAYLDKHIFTEAVHALDYEAVRGACQEILDDWSSDPKMANWLVIRSVVTRMTLQLLGGKTVSHEEAKSITWRYLRHFVELSLFSRYFPFLAAVLGSRKRIREPYFKLKEHGFDNLMVGMTLFAAMFSIGTIVIRCVENVRRHDVDYSSLDREGKRRFVIESLRLFPTVTSVNRVVERDEEVRVGRRALKLTAGDEVIYPFVCVNRDPKHFKDPDRFDIHRDAEEYDKVLSWSTGPHGCPGKEMSILTTMAMLDALAERFSLGQLRIFNPAI